MDFGFDTSRFDICRYFCTVGTKWFSVSIRVSSIFIVIFALPIPNRGMCRNRYGIRIVFLLIFSFAVLVPPPKYLFLLMFGYNFYLKRCSIIKLTFV
ncbi:hypothetical protein Hdeb2414_s0007g00250761 [Helianthus debilis subsp. tardiflorus]